MQYIKPPWRHCIVSLSKTLYHLLSTLSTQKLSGYYQQLVDLEIMHQDKPNIKKHACFWTLNELTIDTVFLNAYSVYVLSCRYHIASFKCHV